MSWPAGWVGTACAKHSRVLHGAHSSKTWKQRQQHVQCQGCGWTPPLPARQAITGRCCTQAHRLTGQAQNGVCQLRVDRQAGTCVRLCGKERARGYTHSGLRTGYRHSATPAVRPPLPPAPPRCSTTGCAAGNTTGGARPWRCDFSGGPGRVAAGRPTRAAAAGQRWSWCGVPGRVWCVGRLSGQHYAPTGFGCI